MIVEEDDYSNPQQFYHKLKPRHRYELVEELFGNFKLKFNYLFEDPQEGYFAEKGFVSDFLAHLYCRIFIPGQDIIKKGEDFPEIYLIYKGTVTISGGMKKKGNIYNEDQHFLVLPTNSYFGEFQILMDLNSLWTYKSSQGDETYCMCLSKKDFLSFLKEYVNANTFF